MTNKFIVVLLLVSALFVVGCKQTTPPVSKPNEPALFKVDPATAGTLKGSVKFTGKQPVPKSVKMDQDPLCAQLHKTDVVDDSIVADKTGALANVFVYIKQGLEDKKFAPSQDQVTIDQHGCWFLPRVLGVQVGQTLKVTNSDPLTHNIHPLAQVNREWNQSQAPEEGAFTRKFSKPEIMIRVKCNIHNWMHSWIGVVDHPYFAVTGEDGSFQLQNVPPGTYTLAIWHESLGTQEQTVTLAPSGTGEITFQFKEESKL
jgi:plastocyanin